jgi:hypothetical protein
MRAMNPSKMLHVAYRPSTPPGTQDAAITIIPNRNRRGKPELRSLNADHNTLAHGHFDQHPFDSSYTLLLAAKTRDHPITRVADLASELARIADQFRHVELAYHFENLTQLQDLTQ